jgi:spermidine/putrescine transport system ATP-binding protein
MNHGRVEQVGSPSEIYEKPRTAFVADFIGDTNLFEGEITGIEADNLQVTTKTGLKMVVIRNELSPTDLSQSVTVSIRPEKIQLSLYRPSIQINCFEGQVINVMYLGTHVNYIVELAQGKRITVTQPNTFGILPEPEMPIYAWWTETDAIAIG